MGFWGNLGDNLSSPLGWAANPGVAASANATQWGYNKATGGGQGNYSAGPSAYGAALSMYPNFTGTGYSATSPQVQQATQGINYNPAALNQLSSEAMRAPGSTSAWGKLAGEQQRINEQAALGQAATGARNQANQAQTGLAATGGLSGGARERVARSGANNSALVQQGVLNQGLSDRLGISQSDEQNRLSSLAAIPGLESGKVSSQLAIQSPYIQALQGDRNAYMQGQQTENAFNLGKYGELMKAYGSDQSTAAQIAEANKPKGLLSSIFGGLF